MNCIRNVNSTKFQSHVSSITRWLHSTTVRKIPRVYYSRYNELINGNMKTIKLIQVAISTWMVCRLRCSCGIWLSGRPLTWFLRQRSPEDNFRCRRCTFIVSVYNCIIYVSYSCSKPSCISSLCFIALYNFHLLETSCNYTLGNTSNFRLFVVVLIPNLRLISCFFPSQIFSLLYIFLIIFISVLGLIFSLHNLYM